MSADVINHKIAQLASKSLSCQPRPLEDAVSTIFDLLLVMMYKDATPSLIR